jgi:TolB-like protein/DNA-binding winged helix-turn-helix (wHTH) protein/Tfp pilus assembly protein PilF
MEPASPRTSMEPTARFDRPIRFGAFEVDLRSGELRKKGFRIRLQEQPFQVLTTLLEHPGEVISREELRERVWPSGTYIDFENGLNKAMSKLREALGDSADAPLFIETLPRRGYRFIAPIAVAQPTDDASGMTRRKHWWIGAASAFTIFLIAAVLLLIRVRTTRTVQAPARQRIESVAVLPLENLSGDPSQDYFADGMTEALIGDLGSIGTVRVISRTSTARYKRTKKVVPDIARELNVDAVVEGTVVRSGDRVRVTARLVRAAPERELWSGSYEREMRDILVLQTDVARAITYQIGANLSPGGQIRVSRVNRQVNPEAYDAFLKARFEAGNWSEVAQARSVEYLESAVRNDPNYADAWSELSQVYANMGVFGWWPNEIARSRAEQAARRALQLDDTRPTAHVTLALLRDREWDWPSATKEYEQALAADPNNADAHQTYGYHLAILGRSDEAVAEMKRALMLDPYAGNKRNSLGAALYWAGRYDEALQQFRQTPDPDVNSYERHRRMAEMYEHKGLEKEAIAELLRALRIVGRTDTAASIETEYRSAGYVQAKKTFLLVDIDNARNGKHQRGYLFRIATDYALLGETQKTLEWLEKAFAEHDEHVMFLKASDRLRSLHFNIRFQDLVRRMGLPS